MKRGQGTFEYVLLLGGVLLIVVLAIVVLQNTATSGFQGTAGKQCNARLLSDINCQSTTESDGWKECGEVIADNYKDCGSVGPITSKPSGTACPALTATTKKYCGDRVLS